MCARVNRACRINSREPVNGDHCAQPFQRGGGDTENVLGDLKHAKQIFSKVTSSKLFSIVRKEKQNMKRNDL